MTSLFHVELDKLRTVRSTWLLLAIQQVAVLTSLGGLVAVGADLQAPTAVRQLLAQAGFMSSLFSLVLGVLAVAGEYRHRTISDTYLATPWRGRVIAARLTTLTWMGAVFGTLSSRDRARPGQRRRLALWRRHHRGQRALRGHRRQRGGAGAQPHGRHRRRAPLDHAGRGHPRQPAPR